MTAALDRLFPGDACVLLDGAMGTALRCLGWPVQEATVLANLEAPGFVATVHNACRDAGARVLHTNTFGALLGAPGSGNRRLDAVRSAVRIARKASRGEALVAGSLGAYDLAFHGPRLDEVVRALVDEGVDLLVFETCNQVKDAQVAVEVHAEFAPRLPAVVCASTSDGTHDDRRRLEEVMTLLGEADPAVEPGLNCCRGPHETFRIALSFGHMPRWLKPSTGPPGDPVDDNVMAAFARAAFQRGARFIGGCCGTGAETLALMNAALESRLR